jgi:nicotinate-nucleotide adenylyltransferase
VMPPLGDTTRIGLLGGTFDPIHVGHLALADYAADHVGLDSVWFIPSAIPPHKDRPGLTSAETRWRMTEAAVKPFAPRFTAIDLEMHRAGPSYTVDTLREIREYVGNEIELFWIVGKDNLADIPRWYKPEQIAELAMIVVGGRPGDRSPASIPDWFLRRLITLDGPAVDTSSTQIRNDARMGRLDPDAIPEPVRRIIESEQLFGYEAGK